MGQSERQTGRLTRPATDQIMGASLNRGSYEPGDRFSGSSFFRRSPPPGSSWAGSARDGRLRPGRRGRSLQAHSLTPEQTLEPVAEVHVQDARDADQYPEAPAIRRTPRKDVIKLNCVNDKLMQVKGHLAVTDQSFTALNTAAAAATTPAASTSTPGSRSCSRR